MNFPMIVVIGFAAWSALLILDAACYANELKGKPMENPPDRPARSARARAHDAFRGLYESGFMTKGQAYKKLQNMLGIPWDECRFSKFDDTTCERILAWLEGGAPSAARPGTSVIRLDVREDRPERRPRRGDADLILEGLRRQAAIEASRPKSRAEIEDLKRQWSADPSWDLAATEGFERHETELREFEESFWARSKSERDRELEARALRLGCSVALVQHIETLEQRIAKLEGRMP